MEYQYVPFNYGELRLPLEALLACHHQGACDDDVEAWTQAIDWASQSMTADDIRKELYEYGAWNDDELADDEANRLRILWIAAGNYQEQLTGTAQGITGEQ